MDDNELLRALARASGYAVRQIEEDEIGPRCELTTPSGKWNAYVPNPTEAWRIIFRNDAPDWLHSVDAALALPWPEDCEISTWTSKGYSDAYLKVWHGNDVIAKHECLNQDTLARALCEVFAVWVGAQEAKEGKG